MKMRVIDKLAKRKIANSENIREIAKLVMDSNPEEVIHETDDIRQYRCESGNIEIGIVSEDKGSHISISIIITNLMSIVLMRFVAYKDKPSEYEYKILTGGYLEDEFNEMYLHKKGLLNMSNVIVELGFHSPTNVVTFGDLFLPKH